MSSAGAGRGGGEGSSNNHPHHHHTPTTPSNIYPASFIKRKLVPGSGQYIETLASLRAMDKDAVSQRLEYWQAEDDLIAQAANLLTSKETSADKLQEFLSSDAWTELEARRNRIMEVRTQTLRLATETYDKVDGSIQALDNEISLLEPQMAAAAAEDLSSLDPQILAIKLKEQRKLQREEKQKAKELAAQKKKQGIKTGKDGVGLVQTNVNGEEVDPNEPVYCTCQQVSSGKMVGCDDDECRFEWFHIECVGLLEPPPDSVTWYCPECCENKGLVYRGAAPATLPGAEEEEKAGDVAAAAAAVEEVGVAVGEEGGGGDVESAAAAADAPMDTTTTSN